LVDKLDYPSKLSRNPQHIAQLVADGETQMTAFLEHLSEDESVHTSGNSENVEQIH
jgi:hypothetical protein